MPVSVMVPAWLSPAIHEALCGAGVAFEVVAGCAHFLPDPSNLELKLWLDCYRFREEAPGWMRGSARERVAARIQRIIDTVPKPPFGSC